MVLELLPGLSLDQRPIDDRPLPWREVAELVALAAAVLDVLHRAGVIHRDVKPSNIVQLSGATDQPLVKWIDVGIAKVEDWARIRGGGFTPPPRHQTDTGLIVGTPGFQPPEVSRMKPTPRFDTFALGETIFMLCTGVMLDLTVPRRMNEVRPECGAPRSAAEIKGRLDSIRHAHANAWSPYLFEDCYDVQDERRRLIRAARRRSRQLARGRALFGAAAAACVEAGAVRARVGGWRIIGCPGWRRRERRGVRLWRLAGRKAEEHQGEGPEPWPHAAQGTASRGHAQRAESPVRTSGPTRETQRPAEAEGGPSRCEPPAALNLPQCSALLELPPDHDQDLAAQRDAATEHWAKSHGADEQAAAERAASRSLEVSEPVLDDCRGDR